MKRWLTIQEAMTLVRRSEKTIYRWIEKGFITARRKGRKTFVLASDVARVESVVVPGRKKGSAKPPIA